MKNTSSKKSVKTNSNNKSNVSTKKTTAPVMFETEAFKLQPATAKKRLGSEPILVKAKNEEGREYANIAHFTKPEGTKYAKLLNEVKNRGSMERSDIADFIGGETHSWSNQLELMRQVGLLNLDERGGSYTLGKNAGVYMKKFPEVF